jgi:putative endonuclease
VSIDARQLLGRRGEQLAVDHLTRRGFGILERNYRTRWGELDVVAFDGHILTFCEVKTRRARTGTAASPLGANPFDAVTPRKRSQVRKMAAQWLIERRDRPYAAVVRFDAIGVTFEPSGDLVALEHLEGAF